MSPDRKETKVCVVGLGYTGLPTATILASSGYTVHGVDVKPDVIELINSGHAPMTEPDLDMLLQAALSTGRFRAYAEPSEAEVYILCVPTPCNADHSADLTFVMDATQSIARFVKPGDIVVLESTSPPGTTDQVAKLLYMESNVPAGSLHVAHAPERVLPGRVLREVVENDRVIGGVDKSSTEKTIEFYSTFVSGELHGTDAKTAEVVKLVENASRDVNIAFANELSMIADDLGLDIWEIIEIANRHPRVNLLRPGPGVGGHCIAVDPWFLVSSAPDHSELIRTARTVNDGKPAWVVERIKRRAERFRSPRIACFGLAYKANVNDFRESPALKIVDGVSAANIGKVAVVEPHLDRHDTFHLATVDKAVEWADILVFLVAHDEFKRIPPQALDEKSIIDACGLFR